MARLFARSDWQCFDAGGQLRRGLVCSCLARGCSWCLARRVLRPNACAGRVCAAHAFRHVTVSRLIGLTTGWPALRPQRRHQLKQRLLHGTALCACRLLELRVSSVTILFGSNALPALRCANAQSCKPCSGAKHRRSLNFARGCGSFARRGVCCTVVSKHVPAHAATEEKCDFGLTVHPKASHLLRRCRPGSGLCRNSQTCLNSLSMRCFSMIHACSSCSLSGPARQTLCCKLAGASLPHATGRQGPFA